MRWISVISVLLLLTLPTVSAEMVFSVESPQINSKFSDYDISKFYCNVENNTAMVSIEVWGLINLDPSRGYLKEYDANISFQDSYLHVYALTKNGSSVFSYTVIGGKVIRLNYSISSSTLTWFIPNSLWNGKVVSATAHAGIIDLGEGRYLFLDTVNYPQEKGEEGGWNMYIYIGIALAIAATVAIMVWRRKK